MTRLSIWMAVAAYLAVINLITAARWNADKQSAIASRQRVPEATLLGLCLIGGWPAGLITALIVRHKTRKPAFVAKLTTIIAVEVIALCAVIVWLT